MKRLFLAGVMLSVSLSIVSSSFAQSGGGRMGVSQQEKTREHLEHGSVMHRLMLMTGMLSEIMAKISGMLKGESIPADRMKTISLLMKDVSEITKQASAIIEKGNASAEELTRLEDRLLQTRKKLLDMEAQS